MRKCDREVKIKAVISFFRLALRNRGCEQSIKKNAFLYSKKKIYDWTTIGGHDNQSVQGLNCRNVSHAITSKSSQLLGKQLTVELLSSDKISLMSCRSMEDGQIGTVKFVGPNQKERCVVQLYVTCRKNVFTFMMHLIPGVFLVLIFIYYRVRAAMALWLVHRI